MKVLISAVGKSDPMTLMRSIDQKREKVYEGSILQICRYYDFDLVILYMSGQICEYDQTDNRYDQALNALKKETNKSFEVRKFKDQKMLEVQEFDAFYNIFENIVKECVDEYGDDTKFWFNISSGTPAMKSTFQIIASLTKYQAKTIQVVDPSRGKGFRYGDIKDYDHDLYWELNEDRHNGVNRCLEPKDSNFRLKIQKEILVSMIKSYEYEAAFELATSLHSKLDTDILNYITFAYERYMMRAPEYLRYQKRCHQRFIPYMDRKERELFEYSLWLKIKIEKSDISDFCRGITPFMYAASKYALQLKCGINMNKYVEPMKKVEYLTRNMLMKDEQGREILDILDDRFSPYKDQFLSEAQMIPILSRKCDDQNLNDVFHDLSYFKSNIRNLASHNIVRISREDIKNRMSHEIEYYLNCVKKVLATLGFDTKDEWNSYEKMNEIIINKIKEV